MRVLNASVAGAVSSANAMAWVSAAIALFSTSSESLFWASFPWVMAAFTMAAMPLGQFSTYALASSIFSFSVACSCSILAAPKYCNLKFLKDTQLKLALATFIPKVSTPSVPTVPFTVYVP